MNWRCTNTSCCFKVSLSIQSPAQRHTTGSAEGRQASCDFAAEVTMRNSRCSLLCRKVSRRLRLVLFGSREKGAKIQAINVLTQVEQSTKKHPGPLQDYNQLS